MVETSDVATNSQNAVDGVAGDEVDNEETAGKTEQKKNIHFVFPFLLFVVIFCFIFAFIFLRPNIECYEFELIFML